MRYFPNLALLLGGQTCLVDRHSQQLLQQVPTFLCTRAQANKDIFIIILRKKYFSRQKLFHNFSAKMYLLFIFPPKTTLLENSRQKNKGIHHPWFKYRNIQNLFCVVFFSLLVLLAWIEIFNLFIMHYSKRSSVGEWLGRSLTVLGVDGSSQITATQRFIVFLMSLAIVLIH